MRKIILFLLFLTSFIFSQTPQVSVPIVITENASGYDTLFFGIDPTATNGIDASLGEYELPPMPPSGNFDVRFVGDDIGISQLGQGVKKDYRFGNISSPPTDSVLYELKYQTGSGTTITIKWNLPANVSGLISDFFGGVLINKVMTGNDSLVVSNPSIISKLKMRIKYTAIITQSITITSPNGGENWQVGSSQNITWTSANITNVKIEYTTDNGTNWSVVALSVPATPATYAWTIPNTPSTNCKVRVSDAVDNTPSSTSANVFTISTPPPVQSITITSPNGGENWQVGSSQNITWISANITNVKIEYTTDGGTNWSTVVASVPSTPATYAWTIPNTPSTNCKVRVSDAADNNPSSTSTNVFTISTPPPVQSITITSPNGGENWQVGSSQNITWTSANITNIKIEYTTDNGTSWSVVAPSVPANPATYAVVIPNTPSTNCKVRVSDATDNTPSSASANVFTISTPPPVQSITITSPNGGENWQVGSSQNITWTSANITNVKIEYTTDNGTSWSVVVSSVPATPATYAWTIPNTPSTNCKVRVSDAADNNPSSTSANVFTIPAPPVQSITITAPNGGENWQVGSSQNITWTSANITNIKIEYTTDNGTNWSVVVSSVPASPATYTTTIPNTPSTNCKVRVSDAVDNNPSSTSANVFTISTPSGTPQINFSLFISDNLGSKDTLKFGKDPLATNGIDPLFGEYELPPVPPTGIFDIRFSGEDISIPQLGQGVKKDYRNGTSSSIDTIIHEIKIQPATNSTSCTIKWNLPSAISGLIQDLITGTIINKSMSGTDSLVLTNLAINKLKMTIFYGTIIQNVSISGFVKTADSIALNGATITFSNGGGTTTTNSNGYYEKTLTNGWSGTVTPTKTDWVFNPTNRTYTNITSNSSNQNYTAIPTLISISGYIKTSDSTAISGVTVTFSNSGGTATTNSNGYYEKFLPYNWSGTATPSKNDYTFNPLVRSYSNISVNQINQNYTGTTIVVSLILLSPNGGENWQIGTTHNITWTSSNISNIKIEYSTNNGTTWNTIISNTPANAGFYPWIISSTPSTQCKVKISNLTGGVPFDESNNVFTITTTPVGTFDIISPVHNSRFVVRNSDTNIINFISSKSNNASSYKIKFGYPDINSMIILDRTSSDTIISINENVIYDLLGTLLADSIECQWSFWSFNSFGNDSIKASSTFTIKFVKDKGTSVKKGDVPSGFVLNQNYPNPFNPSTILSYYLPSRSKVSLRIFDIRGKELVTLVNKEQISGTYSIEFNANNYPAGVYYYEIQIAETEGKGVGHRITKKMLFLK